MSLDLLVPGSLRFSRRALLQLSMALLVQAPARAFGFGQVGSFGARRVIVGQRRDRSLEPGLTEWAVELARRTSAPTRLEPVVLRADEPRLLEEPFAVMREREPVPPFTAEERRSLSTFFAQGGLLVVDDAEPEAGLLIGSMKQRLREILSESAPVRLPNRHVIYRSFYLLEGPHGRVAAPSALEALVVHGRVAVLFIPCDLVGALARKPSGEYQKLVTPGGEEQRERAIRFAINLSMYALCSDYKDDQVHYDYLIRRQKTEVR